MAQYVSPAELSGNFKEVYADDVAKMVPQQAKLQGPGMIPFVEQEKELGNKYHQPLLLSRSHGFTYAAADSGAFALNDHVAPQMKDAYLQGSQILLREAIGYDTAARANKSKKAFRKATELIVEEMRDSMAHRLELSLLYGQSDLGTVASSANSSATVTVLTITLAKWALGIWAGGENCPVDVYQSNGTTKINSNAKCVITVVNFDDRKLTISGNATDIAAIDTYVAANADGARLFFYGAASNEMAGLDKIVTNTGELFGVNATTYNLWKGNSVSAGSATLTMAKILGALAKAVERGLMEDVVCIMNPNTWANVQSDLAALRRYDGSYSSEKATNGSKEIEFFYQNGSVKLVSHSLVKQGECFILPVKRLKRVGAIDITFNTPGRSEEIFLQMPNNAGFELRCYTDQALFCERPAWLVKITAIVNA